MLQLSVKVGNVFRQADEFPELAAGAGSPELGQVFTDVIQYILFVEKQAQNHRIWCHPAEVGAFSVSCLKNVGEFQGPFRMFCKVFFVLYQKFYYCHFCWTGFDAECTHLLQHHYRNVVTCSIHKYLLFPREHILREGKLLL